MDLPKKGIYRHFKGKRYELVDFAQHSETLETMVVYRALYGEGGLWVRPLSMWSEKVERDGKTFTRFVPEDEYLKMQQQSANPGHDSEECASCGKRDILRKVYGYESFREGQEEVIDSVLSGRDTLAILPTGAGKSICYQLPALMMPGVALVVSPLISLMKDQVNALTQAGVPAAYLNSSLTERQFDNALHRMQQGYYRIVYVAPERLFTPRFLSITKQMKISMLAVDEAHCISQWGQDFRPSYLDIPEFISQLPEKPHLCAFTATATERVKNDIIRLLEMHDPFICTTGFNRPNLYLSVSYTYEKDKKLLELMQTYRGFSGIVYCGTRKHVENVCEKLLANGFLATRYHAGLSEEERFHNQEDFIYDRTPIMVATNAFGMGIDKSNVRFVIHYNMPKDIESYYQEAGRAGRDGERADCHLLFEPKDIALQQFFIDKMGEESDLSPEVQRTVQENARFRLNVMADYCRTTRCLRGKILHYFGENSGGNCQYCINCLDPRQRVNVTAAARIIIACVRENNGRFGTRMILDILRGSNGERIQQMHLDDSSYHGALKGISMNNLRYIVDAMIDDAVLKVRGGEFPLLELGTNSNEVIDGVREVWACQDENAKLQPVSNKENLLEEGVDAVLFEKLRQLRMQISKSRSVPPYAVCNDSTLIEMCKQKPMNKDELRFVKGMGDRKIQSFGNRFLKVIIEHLKEE